MGFKKLDSEDLVISTEAVTSTVWSNNTPTLTNFFTSSVQVAGNTGQYYYAVSNIETTTSGSEVQFSVAYCDSDASGSIIFNSLVTGSSPTRTNYGQYHTQILGNPDANFIFGNYSASYFYAINVERARYKEKLLPGVMTLNLVGPGGRVQLTDDSLISPSINYKDAGRVFNLVSGSAGTVNTSSNANGWAGGSTSASGSYGWLLPDIGVVLLNGAALDATSGSEGGMALGTNRNFNTADNNPRTFVNALQTAGDTSLGFNMNAEETLTSDYIFVRARNKEFNYSENPSFYSGSTGAIIYPLFIETPTTYITTVGLYNNFNELVAVAKLSRPLPKDFTKELLVRVKLDF